MTNRKSMFLRTTYYGHIYTQHLQVINVQYFWQIMEIVKTKRNIILKYILCIIIKNHNCILKLITVKFLQQNQYIIISVPFILKEWRISELFFMRFPIVL